MQFPGVLRMIAGIPFVIVATRERFGDACHASECTISRSRVAAARMLLGKRKARVYYASPLVCNCTPPIAGSCDPAVAAWAEVELEFNHSATATVVTKAA